MLPQGTLIDGRYEVVNQIGVGGFGSVYKARQAQFDRLVAIKTLNTTLLQEADGLPRFEREAQAINALKHKNIVGFYGYGIWQQAPYMVMELIEGKSLSDDLSSNTRIEPKRAVMIMRQVFDALACAHAAGVVHRDLKPSNIMLVPSAEGIETVKIIDFGLAKLMPAYGVPGQKLTETGYTLGSCHYMAPEQALGIPVDHRADIYSAGCIFYQILTGELPFAADHNVAVMFRHINDEPIPLSRTLGEHPMGDALAVFLQNCMAKSPADRYQTANSAIEDLNAILDGRFRTVAPLSVPHKKAHRLGASAKSLALVSLVVLLCAGGALSMQLFLKTEQAGKEAQIVHGSDRLYDEFVMRKKVLKEFFRPHARPLLAMLNQNQEDHRLAPHQEFEILLLAVEALRPYPAESKQAERYLSEAKVLYLANPRIQTAENGYTLIQRLWDFKREDEAASIAQALLVKPAEFPIDQSAKPFIKKYARDRLLIYRIKTKRLNEATKLANHLLLGAEDAGDLYKYSCAFGHIASMKQNFVEAENYYHDAADVLAAHKNLKIDGHEAYWGRARTALQRGDYKAARAFVSEARTRWHKVNPDCVLFPIELIDITCVAKLQNHAQALNMTESLLRKNLSLGVYAEPLTDVDVKLCRRILDKTPSHGLLEYINATLQKNAAKK